MVSTYGLFYASTVVLWKVPPSTILATDHTSTWQYLEAMIQSEKDTGENGFCF